MQWYNNIILTYVVITLYGPTSELHINIFIAKHFKNIYSLT